MPQRSWPLYVFPILVIGIFSRLFSVSVIAAEPNLKREGPRQRVLILTGAGDHDWQATSSALRRILTDTERFDVRVCESPIGLTRKTFTDFDLIVDDYAGPSLGPETEQAIASFVESGKGLVVTQAAIAGASKSVDLQDGKSLGVIGSQARRAAPDYWPAHHRAESPSAVDFLNVTVSQPGHAIVQGMQPHFRVADILPKLALTTPSARVIASAVGPSQGRDEPVLVVSDHQDGRIVCFALGSPSSAIHETDWITLFIRACEWAATGQVSLAPHLESPQPSADAVKALLITGGHDHEAAFYTLFQGYKDLGGIPILTSADAFKGDLRGKFDVIVMYDFSRDLEDTRKKNLRDFVESGGGVVVLHHALLNYQNWDWWNNEVVGGSYRLTRVGKTPSSSVKNHQEIFVRPVGDHPVLKGISPFHIQDEAYKNLRMSDKIHPLLTTDNPTSDTNLAWIGPYERARIVAIQLGHGHTAFFHPSYRTLVHNAILWSAGKPK